MTSIIRITSFLIALSVPHVLLAQGYTLISPLGGYAQVNTGDADTYVRTLFNIFMAAAATLAVIRLMVCGIQYMTSEAVSSKSQAKTCLWYVLGGLLLILLSYIVLQTINQNLVGRSANRFFSDIIRVVPESGLNVPNVGAGMSGPPTIGGGGPPAPHWEFEYEDMCGNAFSGATVGDTEEILGPQGDPSVCNVREAAIAATPRYVGITLCDQPNSTQGCFDAKDQCPAITQPGGAQVSIRVCGTVFGNRTCDSERNRISGVRLFRIVTSCNYIP